MNKSYQSIPTLLVILALSPGSSGAEKDTDTAKDRQLTVPVFKDGEAQIVEGFNDPDYWIRHDLWVETNSIRTMTAASTECM